MLPRDTPHATRRLLTARTFRKTIDTAEKVSVVTFFARASTQCCRSADASQPGAVTVRSTAMLQARRLTLAETRARVRKGGEEPQGVFLFGHLALTEAGPGQLCRCRLRRGQQQAALRRVWHPRVRCCLVRDGHCCSEQPARPAGLVLYSVLRCLTLRLASRPSRSGTVDRPRSRGTTRASAPLARSPTMPPTTCPPT